MSDSLLDYYNNELIYLRKLGAEFKDKYPQYASRLMLEPGHCDDPHVERLLEGFAFLTARIHKKVDDELPEITEALLNSLCPHFVRPIPAMSVVEFQIDPRQGKLTTSFPIPRYTLLSSTGTAEGVRCKFRTCYQTSVWPLRVSEGEWRTPERLDPPVKATDMAAACRLMLSCNQDVSFKGLQLRSLQFYLYGDPSFIHSLYELLFNNCAYILLRDPERPALAPIRLPAGKLRAMGFEDSEAMLDYGQRSFSGYRLLQEYFAFPEKFFFFELSGLDELSAGGFGSKAEIVFMISRHERSERHQTLEHGISAATFRLNCAPVVNLFPKTAEPIQFDQTRYEYPIVPDSRHRSAYEVFSVDQVLSSNTSSRENVYFEPLYAARQTSSESAKAFWQVHRRPSTRKNDDGTELFISLLDLEGRAARPGVEALTVRCTCTNRDLVSRLPFMQENSELVMEGAAAVKRIVCLRTPTPAMRPPLGKGQLWRVISHLSLNYLSLVDGKEALQEILGLYNFSGHLHIERQISALLSVSSQRHVTRLVSEHGISFARGIKVEMELDEVKFADGGAFLFGAVLDRFLGNYVTLNSFSQLVVRTKQREEPLKKWAPRAGQKILL
jgi:type VI secretion system protein ImpG